MPVLAGLLHVPSLIVLVKLSAESGASWEPFMRKAQIKISGFVSQLGLDDGRQFELIRTFS